MSGKGFTVTAQKRGHWTKTFPCECNGSQVFVTEETAKAIEASDFAWLNVNGLCSEIFLKTGYGRAAIPYSTGIIDPAQLEVNAMYVDKDGHEWQCRSDQKVMYLGKHGVPAKLALGLWGPFRKAGE